MVGTGRFELPTPRTPSECSTRLSHVPTGRIPPLTKNLSAGGGVQRNFTPLDGSRPRRRGIRESGPQGRTPRSKSPRPERCRSSLALDASATVFMARFACNPARMRPGLDDHSRSRQFLPTPISTCNGTPNSCTCSMCSRTSGRMISISFSGTSNTNSS